MAGMGAGFTFTFITANPSFFRRPFIACVLFYLIAGNVQPKFGKKLIMIKLKRMLMSLGACVPQPFLRIYWQTGQRIKKEKIHSLFHVRQFERHDAVDGSG
ncbi:MAG: hypothetical protein ACREFE_05840 [Limisphaerales bacterium]